MYNSEHGQDKWLNDNVFKNKKNGVFVEFGAIDGLNGSNSLFFEKELGWTGLCIEPNPIEYERLTKNRKCLTENCGIGPMQRMMEFMYIPECTGWSGFTDYIEPQHEERIMKNNFSAQIMSIPVYELESILADNDLYHIDYMTIDVEGAELPIIESFCWDSFDIEIVDIEDNWQDNNMDEIMERNGYEKIARIGINNIYKRKRK